MRARLFTVDGTLGFVDLVDGVEVASVAQAIRQHRLFITPEQSTPLPASVRDGVTLEGTGPTTTEVEQRGADRIPPAANLLGGRRRGGRA
ncbi:MAG: hypothetical protein JNK15_03105 [Planctomycetes bacterium]|nr:hypothetical protein [Planctomycetota bacterium]